MKQPNGSAKRIWLNGRRQLVRLAILLAIFCCPLVESLSVDEKETVEKLLKRELRWRRRSTFEPLNDVVQFINPDEAEEDQQESNYSDEWVVAVDGGVENAKRLAEWAGYELVRPIRGFDDHYLFKSRTADERDGPDENGRIKFKRRETYSAKTLADIPEIKWVKRQKYKLRVKRDGNPLKQEVNNVDNLFNDPYWPKQWQLHDTRTKPNLPKLDLHVVGAWKMGYSGKGTVVSILDDGVQRNHSDLSDNYDPKASWDLNDDDDDPTPRFNDDNRHGTRCAGEVSMVANNGICGVGVAYNAKIGGKSFFYAKSVYLMFSNMTSALGVRMLDGKVTDRLEAEALKLNIDHIDVFSASWGPFDDGRTVEGPGPLTAKALVDGVRHGRNGKGVIYVWASGNGGTFNDDCNCDGYTDSIYTLSVSSASETGHSPWYAEKCASTLAATYSSGAYMDQKITTTDIEDKCTTEHTGTSASAPLAAGIVALGLEANPSLSWRDCQHLVVYTSEPAPLLNNDGWHKNGRGLLANARFGFGLMNAEAFVKAAKDWTLVGPQLVCITTFPQFQSKPLSSQSEGRVRFKTDVCDGKASHVKYLEHVQLITDIDYSRRGNLAIYLTSPSG